MAQAIFRNGGVYLAEGGNRTLCIFQSDFGLTALVPGGAEPQLKIVACAFLFLQRTSFILPGRGVHKDKRARLITPLYLLPTTH